MDPILKPIVKVVLKAFAPVVGSLTVDLADAGVGRWLDAQERAMAEDVAARLLKRLTESVVALAQAERLSDTQIESALADVRHLIGKTREFVRRWSAADFDARRAARDAIAANRGALAGLSPEESILRESLLVAIFDALSGESKAIEATEASFRTSVLSRLDQIGADVQRLSQDDRAVLDQVVTAAALSLRSLVWRPDLLPPGAMLRADIDDPVPFHGRTAELDDALQWSLEQRPVAVRLYTGAGGIGKTRLMRELVTRLRTQGWKAGFLDGTFTTDQPQFWRAVAAGAEARLYVIDYAENRRREVVRLARELLGLGASSPRRVVLLARAGDDWWSQLKVERDGVGDLLSGPATQKLRLGPVASKRVDREASYRIAAEHFARKLNRSLPGAARADLDDDAYERALLLHMAALAAVEDVQVKGEQGVLHYVLGRERRFWSDHLAARGLPPHLQRGVGRAMAAVTLSGGAPAKHDALGLLSRIEVLADQPIAVQEAIAQMLHELYPGEHWIEPILPDLLGEQLTQEELEDDPDALLGLVFD